MRSTGLFALVPAVLLATGITLALRTSPMMAVHAAAPPKVTEGARTVYKNQCSLCHGVAGEGSQMGLALHVKDLRSKEVQALPDDVIRQNILNGNPKGMPAFKSVPPADVEGLIALVRTFRK